MLIQRLADHQDRDSQPFAAGQTVTRQPEVQRRIIQPSFLSRNVVAFLHPPVGMPR